MKVLVTGSAGFIGSNLVLRLLRTGQARIHGELAEPSPSKKREAQKFV